MNDNAHLGRKISRLRELRGMKQEALAEALGVSQQAVSKLEQSEKIEETTLERVAKILGVSASAIKNFNEDSLFIHIENMNDQSSAVGNNHQPVFNFNPVDKLIETIEENKKLYERLLASEQEKVELLKKVLDKK